jgi:hypothetical protein
MKTHLIAVCLILISGITVAQWQQSGTLSPYTNYENPTKQAKDMISDNPTLPEPHMNANLSEKKPLAWNWDTLTCFDKSTMLFERYIQTFDDNGNILTRTVELRQSSGWINYLKTTYTYTYNGKMLTELEQSWQNGDWQNNLRYTYSYNNYGKLHAVMLEKWQLDVWANISKSTNTYDTYGRLAMVLNENWHFTNWENYRKTIYTYDPDGNILLWTSQLWSNKIWTNDWRYTYSYDVNGNNITILHQNGLENTWLNEWSDTCTYDILGNVNTEVYVTWQINTWVNNTRWTNSYDLNGNLSGCISELWKNDAWKTFDRHLYYTYGSNLLSDVYQLYKDYLWVNVWKYTYDYDFKGNMISYSRDVWQTKRWMYDWRYSYSYDKRGNSLSGEYEKWGEITGWQPGIPDYGLAVFSGKIQIYILYDIYRYTANYITFTSGITDYAVNNNLLLYPNPANDNITIELTLPDTKQKNVIYVSDILGNLILQQPVQQAKTTINISDLSAGIYFIKVNTKNGIIIKKLVKE